MSKPKPRPDEGRAAQGLVQGIMRAVEQYNRETGLAPPETPKPPAKAPRRRKADPGVA